MAVDITVKRGDTWPPLKATLEELNEEVSPAVWEPVNLTGAESIHFNAKSEDGTVLIEGNCVVTNAAQGKVSYTWGATDTAYASQYKVEFEIHWTSTHIQTIPNSGIRGMLIEPEVGST